jgi:hypothetical protein
VLIRFSKRIHNKTPTNSPLMTGSKMWILKKDKKRLVAQQM